MNSLLLDLLREGRYILYARHGEATIGEDRPGLIFRDCSTQRNLSELGRRQAVYYGQLLRTLQIPVGYPILTSPFCRAVETGQLAFGQNSVQIDRGWFDAYNLSRNVTQQQRDRILDELQSKLEIIPAPGTNQVIIAHSFPAGIGLGQIPDMGTVVLRPLGQGSGYDVVARLSLEEFAELQNAT